MVRVSVLNVALKSMYNAEKRGKRQVMIRPAINKSHYQVLARYASMLVSRKLNHGLLSFCPRWAHCTNNICWHHGSRRGKEEECGRKSGVKVIHGRWAMLGALGCITPEVVEKWVGVDYQKPEHCAMLREERKASGYDQAGHQQKSLSSSCSLCFDAGVKEIEPWTAKLSPSRQLGHIVLTTSAGIWIMKRQGGRMWEEKWSVSSIE
uniref:Uncharacterized protein n=1 Tax=Kalanchoe fedtschenkoi TaxID=63787 RepID=A0A7N0SXP6_KALFE